MKTESTVSAPLAQLRTGCHAFFDPMKMELWTERGNCRCYEIQM